MKIGSVDGPAAERTAQKPIVFLPGVKLVHESRIST